MPSPIFIYSLTDPRDGRVRYIGQSHKPETRVDGHLIDARALAAYRKARPDYKGSAKSSWLLELYTLGLRPRLNIIDICLDGDNVPKIERLHIEGYLARGFDLVNTYRRPRNGQHKPRK